MTAPYTNSASYDEIAVGGRNRVGSYLLERDEIIEFAKRWDPMPFHIDEALAAASPHGGLIASGTHMMAIRIHLLQSGGTNPHVIASLGYEEVKFLGPGRPGDELTLYVECIWKRESESRPGTGLVKLNFEMENQAGEKLLTMIDTILIRKKADERDL